MAERNIRITQETYVVHEKLARESYNVKTDPHNLSERGKLAREAGVRLEFYAHIPQLETRDENALVRKFELDGAEKKDKPVPQKFKEMINTSTGIITSIYVPHCRLDESLLYKHICRTTEESEQLQTRTPQTGAFELLTVKTFANRTKASSCTLPKTQQIFWDST